LLLRTVKDLLFLAAELFDLEESIESEIMLCDSDCSECERDEKTENTYKITEQINKSIEKGKFHDNILF
jgi:hypothetical protein